MQRPWGGKERGEGGAHEAIMGGGCWAGPRSQDGRETHRGSDLARGRPGTGSGVGLSRCPETGDFSWDPHLLKGQATTTQSLTLGERG